MSIVYKVTTDDMRSAVMFDCAMNIKYPIGRKVSPKFGKIFAFRTKIQGEMWMKGGPADCRKLWKCEAHVFRKRPLAMSVWCAPLVKMELFWKNYNDVDVQVQDHGIGDDYELTPDGTVYCNWIKLLEEVFV